MADPVVERLKWLREDASLGSKADAARAYGIGEEIYKKIAGGTRSLTKDHAETIARHHSVSPGWLMFGTGSPRGESSVEVKGFIGAGQQIGLFEDSGEAARRVEALLNDPAAYALEVRGESMFPLAHEGDTIFVAPPRRDLARLIGRECAAQLQDGRRFFKILERGSRPGLYDLRSYNAETMRDVDVHSAGSFLGVRRR